MGPGTRTRTRQPWTFRVRQARLLPVGTPTQPIVVEATGLTRRFGLRRVLHGVDLRVEAGECVGLLGGNGAGKSTLLRLLAGVARPQSGTVSLFGADTRSDAIRTMRARVGLVGHEAMIYSDLSPRENLEVTRRLYACAADPEAMLERVGLARVGQRPSRTLSRGMLQRLALARALLPAPELLLLDEPFTGLDEEGSDLLRSVLREHRDRGGTSLLISHSLEAVAALATRVVILQDGRIATEISPVPSAEQLRERYRATLGTGPANGEAD